MQKRIILFFSLGLAIVVATGCGSPTGGASVVAAFYPLAYAAEQVGVSDVENLTPAGAEPHDLELSAGDLRRIREARLVLFFGHGFQPALEDAVADRDGPSLDLLDGQELVTTAPEAGADVDPHVWLDPYRYARIARAIGAELGDPSGAKGLVERLDALDRELAAGLHTCARREVVTSHAAFTYLADRYGLRQVPLAGLSPEAEPSPKDVESLVEEVRRTGATTVFFETLASPRLAETVAREAGVGTAVLNPLEGLTRDQIEGGEDYFTVMRQNLAALRKALGCM